MHVLIYEDISDIPHVCPSLRPRFRDLLMILFPSASNKSRAIHIVPAFSLISVSFRLLANGRLASSEALFPRHIYVCLFP